MADKIIIHYDHKILYSNADLNEIGATDSTILREVDTISGDTAYVRKFGTEYLITEVTDIEDPVDVNMKFLIYSLSGVLLGSREGGQAFIAGSTVTAQGCYLEIEADGGNVTVLAGIDVDTDIDVGGLTFVCAAETIQDGNTLRLYLSDTSSTYYDSELIYGGDRHTPVLDDIRLPYFTQASAYTALNSANDGCVTLDNVAYDEELNLNRATTLLLAASGQIPTITRGIGARVTRTPTREFNNTRATYFNITGSNATGDGSWQKPYQTLNFAVSNKVSDNIVFGGIGAFFNESMIISTVNTDPTDVFLQADYNYNPTLNITGAGLFNDAVANSAVSILGFTIIGNFSNYLIKKAIAGAIAGKAFIIDDCDISDFNAVIHSSNNANWNLGLFERNHVDNCNYLFFSDTVTNNLLDDCQFNKNIIKNTGTVFNLEISYSGDTIFQNNVFYNNTTVFDYVEQSITIGTGQIIKNNTFINNTNDIIKTGTQTLTFTIDNNIFLSNTTCINTNQNMTINNNCFYDNTTKFSGGGTVTDNNPINDDPLICNETNEHFGVQSISPCYRTGNDSDDVGIKTRIIEINASNVIINGFNISGQNGYATGIFIVDTVNHIGTIIKWCTTENFIGGIIDFYDDDTNLDVQLLNCIFRNSGYSVGLHYGGNIITECLFYKNSQQGLYCNQAGHTINHCTFFGNNYGIYFDTNATEISLKNSIFSQNAEKEIFSINEISDITYCCINGSVSEEVQTEDLTNIFVDPLFTSVVEDEEDFHIKTVESGWLVNSGCKDKGKDTIEGDVDIGVYKVDRNFTENYRRTYQLFYNPSSIDYILQGKGVVDFENGLGSLLLWAKDQKRIYTFAFNEASEKEQSEKLDHFTSRIRMRSNGIDDNRTKFLLEFLSSSKLLEGTNAIIKSHTDGSGIIRKKVVDIDKSIVESSKKGFWLSIKFLSIEDLIIDSENKTGKLTTGSFTVNQFKNYWIYLNNRLYFILSNDSDELLLSDPEDTLIDETVDIDIQKFYKIVENDVDYFVINDPDNDLDINDIYDYYINIFEGVIQDPNITKSQDLYDFLEDVNKIGHTITFEES